MDSVFSVVDQRLPVVCDDIKSIESPAQNVVAPLALIVGADGKGLTVKVVVIILSQPEAEEREST